MKLKRRSHADNPIKDSQVKVNLIGIDLREDPIEVSLTPIKDVNIVQIGAQSSQITQIESSLSPEEEAEIIKILRENVDLLAWKLVDMPGIGPNIGCHHQALYPTIKPITQRKRKKEEENRRVVEDEVRKLMKVDFIKEIRYPTWLDNIIMVKKMLGKW